MAGIVWNQSGKLETYAPIVFQRLVICMRSLIEGGERQFTLQPDKLAYLIAGSLHHRDIVSLSVHFKERPEDTEWFIAAKNRVSRLGVVLIATAILCGLSNFGGLVVLSAIKQQNQAPQAPPPNMKPEEQKQWERGRDSAPFFDFLCVGFVSLVYLPVFLGGIALQRGSSRGLGMTAAIMAMFPCSPGFLLGLPVGIWALIVLNNQDVKHVLQHRPRDEDDYDRRR